VAAIIKIFALLGGLMSLIITAQTPSRQHHQGRNWVQANFFLRPVMNW
jgi:hypothetical protein